MARPIPLRPDPRALAANSVSALARVAIVRGLARLERRTDERALLRARWPDDPLAPLVLRAASTPTSFATAPGLGTSIIADLIATIGPVGAGASLLQAGLQLTFDRAQEILVPGFEASAYKVSFVAEGAPIPVRGLTATMAKLVPHKLAVIVALTQEMLASSNAEALVTDALVRSTGLALDAALFDDAAADAVRPAGLRHGIAASDASDAAVADEAMLEDLVDLARQVADVGGPIIFVASPVRAALIALRARRELPFAVLGSPAVVDDDVLAVAATAVASAVDGTPEIEAARHATITMDDAPAAPADDAEAAPPVRSLLQTDTVGIKLRFNISWALRDLRAVAWTTVTAW